MADDRIVVFGRRGNANNLQNAIDDINKGGKVPSPKKKAIKKFVVLSKMSEEEIQFEQSIVKGDLEAYFVLSSKENIDFQAIFNKNCLLKALEVGHFHLLSSITSKFPNCLEHEKFHQIKEKASMFNAMSKAYYEFRDEGVFNDLQIPLSEACKACLLKNSNENDKNLLI